MHNDELKKNVKAGSIWSVDRSWQRWIGRNMPFLAKNASCWAIRRKYEHGGVNMLTTIMWRLLHSTAGVSNRITSVFMTNLVRAHFVHSVNVCKLSH